MGRSMLTVGAHCRVYINGQPFGRTISGEFFSETPRREVKVLDSFVTYEMIHQGPSTGGQLRVYRSHGDGGAQAAGIVAFAADLSIEKYFSILILDRFSDTTIYRADRCSLNREHWSLPTKGYVTGTLDFKGLDWSNEAQSKLTSSS